jgi:hypothetical protein
MCASLTKALGARAGARDELERGLAEAVLEVLKAQPMAMNPQQDVALGRRHARHGLSRIVASRPTLSRHRLLLRPSAHQWDTK